MTRKQWYEDRERRLGADPMVDDIKGNALSQAWEDFMENEVSNYFDKWYDEQMPVEQD